MRIFRLLAAITLCSLAGSARAQQPDAPAPGVPPPQGYLPQQPPQYPPNQPPPQGYPAPQQPQQYPPNQPPPQGYPAPQQPPPQYPPNQPPPQALPPQANPSPQPPAQPGAPQGTPAAAPKIDDDLRSQDELVFMYGAGVAYGVGAGVWIDALAKADDPGVAVIAPLALGVAVPTAMAIWDNVGRIHKAVPASVGTGLTLGAMEGIAIAGTNWQLTRAASNQWSFAGNASLTLATATAGGIGGYLFGEFGQPERRSMALIASGAGWGAITGTILGAGVTGTCDASSPYASDRYCVWNGAAIGGLVAMNLGVIGAGVASVAGYVPSNDTLKWQWIGFGAGLLATMPIYIFYAFSDADPKHGLVANAFGGLAGLTLATVFTLGKNAEESPKAASWTPPFLLSLAPVKGGMTVGATGVW